MVQLANGAWSVRSHAHQETFHPVIGPVAEAEALYVGQLNLLDRFRHHAGPFVVWDVGLGAAGNALTVLQALSSVPGAFRMISFDNTLEPLQFALQHADRLSYLHGFEARLKELLAKGRVCIETGHVAVEWELRVGDFPSVVAEPAARAIPKPHAILFDAYSPAKNPAMWTQPLFANLFRLLESHRPCALPTYSRSTMLRVSLLLAGFFVGSGHATGEKEETTIAANTLELIRSPLDRRWLQRARRSTSAEPLWEPRYRQAPLSPSTWAKLQQHPQFQ